VGGKEVGWNHTMEVREGQTASKKKPRVLATGTLSQEAEGVVRNFEVGAR